MTDEEHRDTSAATDTSGQIDEPAETDDRTNVPESVAPPPRRRWRAVSHASHRHPVALPLGVGIAGLLLGAGLTAAVITDFAPPGQAPNDVSTVRVMPPNTPQPAEIPPPPPPPAWDPGTPPPPRAWSAPPPPGRWDAPPPPPPGWGPPPPPPGWGPPPPPPFGGPPPPPPPAWGAPPPPGPWGPPPPPS